MLTYYQVKGFSGMKKDSMAAKWKDILDSQKEAPSCSKWSTMDEIKVATLISQPIVLADTALGRNRQIIKKR